MPPDPCMALGAAHRSALFLLLEVSRFFLHVSRLRWVEIFQRCLRLCENHVKECACTPRADPSKVLLPIGSHREAPLSSMHTEPSSSVPPPTPASSSSEGSCPSPTGSEGCLPGDSHGDGDWDAFSLLFKAIKASQEERKAKEPSAEGPEAQDPCDCTQIPPAQHSPSPSPFEDGDAAHGYFSGMVMHSCCMLALLAGSLAHRLLAGGSAVAAPVSREVAGLAGSMWVLSGMYYAGLLRHGGIVVVVGCIFSSPRTMLPFPCEESSSCVPAPSSGRG